MSAAFALRGLGVGAVAATLVVLARLGYLMRTQRASLAERLGAATAPLDRPPCVSVLIPARNEAHGIGACVLSVLAQDTSVDEVLVLDDSSADATATIVAAIAAVDLRVRLLRADSVPAGWTGKCHALHRLAAAARGDLLLFLDADTRLRPGSVAACVRHFRRLRLDAMSCLGERVPSTIVEKIWEPVWPCVLFFLIGQLDRVGLPESPANFASGAWFIMTRSAYGAVGGHAAIRGEIVEDCALAARIKQAGLKLAVVDTPELYALRMYSSAGELVAGWSKNAFRLVTFFLRRTRRTAAVAIAVILLVTVAPFALAAAAAFGAAPELGVLGAYGPAALALIASLAVRFATGRHPIYFWSLPAGGLLAAGVLAYSALRVLSGRGVVWKGRRYV